jgi:hypothetical protein
VSDVPVAFAMTMAAVSAAVGDAVANPVGLLTVASLLAAGLVLVVVVRAAEPPASPVRIRAIALRERSRRTAFLKLTDPGAAGRSRPRAPGI